mmetsp:Transcript_35634/g.54506  ORF Transcript_35634/g.54506 Transcript_35634/m.54506 type:complete len:109 (+) Transcript_35634:17-343(+)
MKFVGIAALLGASRAINTWEGGPIFSFSYVGDSKFQIDAEIPEEMYLAIGYGRTMTNTDMVYFAATGAGEVADLYSTGESTPVTDFASSYTGVTVDTTSTPGVYKFSA